MLNVHNISSKQIQILASTNTPTIGIQFWKHRTICAQNYPESLCMGALLQNSLEMVFQSLASSMIWAALKISLLYKIISLCIYNQVHTMLAHSLNMALLTKPVSTIKHDRPPRPPNQSCFIFIHFNCLCIRPYQLNSLQLSNLPAIFPISCCYDWIHPVCTIFFPFQVPGQIQ